MIVGWCVTRFIILVFMATFERFVIGDVYYYWRKLDAMSGVGLEQTLTEYPTPVVWILSIPHLLTGGSRVGYLIAFIGFMMVLDAAFTWLLWRDGGRRRTRAIDFWLIFVLLVGPLAYLRFDMIPAVLAGGALLVARRRPWLAGLFTGLGAAIKLWPALLFPALLAPRQKRGQLTLGFVGMGAGLALLSLLTGGWTRLFSPLTWQSGRGLQIESLWATPLMLARLVSRGRWTVDISRFQAFEIFGPGVSSWLIISDLATVIGIILIVVLLWRGFRHPDPSTFAVGLVMLAVVVIMVVSNKTLSPQYLLWLAGPMAGLLLWETRPDLVDLPAANLSVDRPTIGTHRLARRLSLALLIIALLTHLVYPSLYDGLLGRWGTGLLVAATLVTVLRNLALLLYAGWICRVAWLALDSRRPGR